MKKGQVNCRVHLSVPFLFGMSCSLETQASIMVILQFFADGFEDKYIGLPVPEGRMKAAKFHSTKDKFLNRL